MDPLTERVFEDNYWLVLLMAVIAFFGFTTGTGGRRAARTKRP